MPDKTPRQVFAEVVATAFTEKDLEMLVDHDTRARVDWDQALLLVIDDIVDVTLRRRTFDAFVDQLVLARPVRVAELRAAAADVPRGGSKPPWRRLARAAAVVATAWSLLLALQLLEKPALLAWQTCYDGRRDDQVDHTALAIVDIGCDHTAARGQYAAIVEQLTRQGTAVIVWAMYLEPGRDDGMAALDAALGAEGTPRSIATSALMNGRWHDPHPALTRHSELTYIPTDSDAGIVRTVELGRFEPSPYPEHWSAGALAHARQAGVDLAFEGPGRVRIGDAAWPVHAAIVFPRSPRTLTAVTSTALLAGSVADRYLTDGVAVIGSLCDTEPGARTVSNGETWHTPDLVAALVEALRHGHVLTVVGIPARIALGLLLGLGLAAAAVHPRSVRARWRWLALGVLGPGIALGLGLAAFAAGIAWPWTDLALLCLGLAAAGGWADAR